MIRNPKWYIACVVAVALVMMVTVPVEAKAITGTLTSISPDELRFAMTDDDGNDHELRLQGGAKVLINEEEANLADLQQLDRVVVEVEFKDKEMVATLIRCTRE